MDVQTTLNNQHPASQSLLVTRGDLVGFEMFFRELCQCSLPSCSHVKFSAVPTAEGWSCLFPQVLLSQFSTWEVTRDHLFPPLLFHYPGAIWRQLPQRCVDAAENRQYKITKKLHSRVLNIIFESFSPPQLRRDFVAGT